MFDSRTSRKKLMAKIRTVRQRTGRLERVSRDITERKRVEQVQRVLYEIANAVNTTADINELFKSIRHHLGKVVDTTNFFIAQYDREKDMILLPYSKNVKDKYTSFPAGKSLIAYVIKNDKPLLATEEVIKELKQRGEAEEFGAPAKVWVGVPLKVGKEVVGAVGVQSYTDASVYTEKDLEVLEFVSDQIAIVMERKRAEEALAEERNLLHTLIEGLPAHVFIKDTESRFVLCNTALANREGAKTPEELIGKTDFDLYPEELARQFYADEQEIIRSGRPLINQEQFGVDKAGNKIWGLTSKVPLRDSRGKIAGIVGIARDITERKEAEKKLLAYQAQLKSLASELSLTEERERRRIAVQLHDQIGQSLVVSKIKLEALPESTSSKEVCRVLDEVCHSLDQTIQNTRSLTFDLGSPVLYELGFEVAVAEWLAEQIQEKHGIATEFEDDEQPKFLDDDVRGLLFRNVRELLINVVKHARAHKVKVSIRKVDGQIHVSVEDDGVGFDPAEVTSTAARRAEFGLFSIRERLEQSGGHLEIDSEPGRGSRITMTAPLKG